MPGIDEILQRLEQLETRVDAAEHERDEYRRLYLETMERCRKLERGLLASKSEHLTDDQAQLSLGMIAMTLDERQRANLDAALAAADAEQHVESHTRRKPTGRKPLPEHLPRVEIEVLPPEVQRDGLDAFERIGEDVCETVERRPASPYCPDANRIERVWQDLHANVTRNHRCKRMLRLLDEARRYLEGYRWRRALERPVARLAA